MSEQINTNPNNCTTCDYKDIKSAGQAAGDSGHCYMFRDAPTNVCGVHTGNKKLFFGKDVISTRLVNTFASMFHK